MPPKKPVAAFTALSTGAPQTRLPSRWWGQELAVSQGQGAATALWRSKQLFWNGSLQGSFTSRWLLEPERHAQKLEKKAAASLVSIHSAFAWQSPALLQQPMASCD